MNLQSSPMPADPTQSEPLPAYRRRRLEDPPRAAIIGGGPLGLEAAVYAARLGHGVLLFEREPEIAPDVRAWGHLTMFTDWSENRSSLGELFLRETAAAQSRDMGSFPAPGLHPTGERYRERYLQPLAEALGDAVHLDTRVTAVGRAYMFAETHQDEPEKRSDRRFRLVTRTPRDERMFTADYIIDASGMTHTPKWAGAGGLPAMGEMGSFRQIFHTVPDIMGRDRISFLGKRVLLIGNGPSSASCAVALAEVAAVDPETSIVWASASRSALPLQIIPNDPVTRRDTLLKKANLLLESKHPAFTYSPVTQVEALQYSLAHSRFQVTLQVNHETKRMQMDAVIAVVGYRPDVTTYDKALVPNEQDIYGLGEKFLPSGDSTPGDFLLARGRTQIRDIFRRITGQPDLDLYADAELTLKAMRPAE